MSTTSLSASLVPHRSLTGYDDAIGQSEPIHCGIAVFISKHENAGVGVWKSGDVVDRNRVHRIFRPGVRNQKEPAQAGVLLIDVVHHNVVNAESGRSFRRRASVSTSRKSGGQNNATAGVGDLRISDRDICDLTYRAHVPFVLSMLIFGSEKYAETILRETAPNVFHQVAFDQDTRRILQFQVISNAKRLIGLSSLVR